MGMGGETWSKTLGEVCRKIVYEKVGEDELYEAYYRKMKEAPSPSEDEAAVGETGISGAMCSLRLKECETGPKKPKPPVKEEKEAAGKKGKGAKAEEKSK